MRVVKVVSNNAVPYDRRVWLEAVTLAEAGHAVTVICPREPGAMKRAETLEGVDVRRYSLPIEGVGTVGLVAEFLWSFLAIAAKLLRIRISSGTIHVLHVANPPETLWPLALVMQQFGTKFVFDHHDLSPEMYLAKGGSPNGMVHRALLFMERRTLRQADLVVATNHSYADLAVERAGIKRDKIVVVRSAPDPTRWQIEPVDESIREGKRYAIGYLGEMGDQDGIDHLLDAAVLVRCERDDIRYVLIGDGPHQEYLQNYASKVGLDDVVTFTGRQVGDALCGYMSSLDLAVCPDPKTNWSDRSTMNKILDYMFFALPMVSYDLTESRVSAGTEAALFVDGHQPADLARGILALMDDEPRRAAMGAAGRERLLSELTWEHSGQALLAAYGRLERNEL